MNENIIVDNYTIDSNIETILENVQMRVSNGKLRNFKRTSSGISVPCPHHSNGLEKTNSCYIQDNGVFHCFACGEKGGIDKFVAECFDWSTKDAKNWLIDQYGKLNTGLSFDLDDININQSNETVPVTLSESILSSMESYHPYMTKRKLSKEICEKFKIKFDKKSQCIVFPVWDEENRLVMLTRRNVLNKRFMIPSNVEKPVYLLNYIIDNNIKDIIVCESQINALWLWTLGYPAIALFGTGTSHQYDVLNKCDIIRYKLCFDGDDAGNKGRERFKSNIRKDVFIEDIKMPKGKDVNDLSKEEVLNLLGGDINYE